MLKIFRLNVIFYFCLVFFSLIVFPSKTEALTLTPTRFEITGNPGEIIENELTIVNENKLVETYYVSYSNFEAQGESGTPAFVKPDGDLGTWMKTDAESYTVLPGQQKRVKFKINIPKDADPGGHFAVIFFGSKDSGSSQVSVGAQTGVLILLSVRGEVKESAGLLDFKTSNSKFFYKTLPVSLEYRFKNDGGDRIKPAGYVTLRNLFFIRTDKINANPTDGNVLPGSIRKFKTDWIKYERPLDYVIPDGALGRYWSNVYYEWKNFALGLYSANLKIAYGSQEVTAHKTKFFFVFPWELFIVLIVVAVVLYFGGRYFVGRYNRYIIRKAKESMKL